MSSLGGGDLCVQKISVITPTQATASAFFNMDGIDTTLPVKRCRLASILPNLSKICKLYTSSHHTSILSIFTSTKSVPKAITKLHPCQKDFETIWYLIYQHQMTLDLRLSLTLLHTEQTDTLSWAVAQLLLNLRVGETRSNGSWLRLCLHRLQKLGASAGRNHHIERACNKPGREEGREGLTIVFMAQWVSTNN